MNLMRQISATLLLMCLVTFTYAQGEGCATALAIAPGVITADGPSTGMMANQPDATHADWYSFTPTESGLLSIDACGGGADTRVWIYSGDCGALVLEASNDDFCDLGDGNAFASGIENLVLAAGTTYFIEWDDRWFQADPAILHPAFDFTFSFTPAPPNDGAAIASLQTYYQIPDSQIPATGLPLSVTVANLGVTASTNTTVTVDIQDATGAVIFSNTTAAIPTIAPFEQVDVLAVAWAGAVGSYTVCYTVAIDEADGNTDNDQLCHPLVISQTTYGNDDPAFPVGGLGIAGPGTIDQGNQFFMYEADMMTSITVFIGGGAVGDMLEYQVFEINADTVSTMVYNSGPTSVVAAGQGFTNHILTAPLALNGGQAYMVNTRHTATGTNIAIGTSPSIFTVDNAWVNVNDGGWTHPEAFGFNIAYLIRPNFGVGTYACISTVDVQNETVDAAGINVINFDAAGAMVGTNPCVDNGDGTWTCQFTGTSLETGGFLYVNGATNEAVPMGCGADPGTGFNFRPVAFNFEDVNKGVVCFADCASCPTDQCVGPNDILCEDLEIYDASMPLGPQSPAWTTWSGTEGGAEDGIISTTQAASGTQSLSIVGGAGGGPQDVVLLLGDRMEGRYRLTQRFYVPSGNGAYFNMQHFEVVNTEFAYQITFNPDGTALLDAENVPTDFTYPQDVWFTVDQIIDVDNDWTTIMVNGEQLYSWPFSAQAFDPNGTGQIGGLDYFPLDENFVFFVDDIFFENLPPCSLNAATIICEDFEFYEDASILGPQSSFWSTWSGTEGGAEDAIISTDFAASGANSMLIAEGQAQDVLLRLGGRNTGFFELKWLMYVPAGANGYYNLQGDETVNVSFPIEVFFNPNGAGQVTNGSAFAYPHDAWFEVSQTIDLDANELVLTIDGNVVEASWPFPDPDVLGGVDFFSIDATNRYYVDNLTLTQLPTPDPTLQVTFQVDMNGVIDAGLLSANGVHIMADFNNFDPAASEMLDPDGDGIYTFTEGLLQGTVTQFRYVNGNALGADENGVDADCGVDGGAGVFNRVWTVGAQSESTLAWCFNECGIGGCTFLSIDELDFNSGIRVFPNPATGNTGIYYNFPEAVDLNVRMTNSVGQLVYNNRINNAFTGNVQIDVNDIAPGVYFVTMSDGENLVTKKLFVQK